MVDAMPHVPHLALYNAFSTYPVDNVVRLLMVMIAVPIGLVCVKFAWTAARNGDFQRMWGVLSYGAMGAAPAGGSIFRFGHPMPWLFASIYLLGLLCACVSLYYHVTINPPWERWGRRNRTTEPPPRH